MKTKTKKPAPKSKAAKAKKPAAATPAKADAPAKVPAQTTVAITAAKGRPMLTWVGKRPLRHVTAFPAQHIETFAPEDSALRTPHSALPSGLLYHGDNKEVLAHLLADHPRTPPTTSRPAQAQDRRLARDGGQRDD